MNPPPELPGQREAEPLPGQAGKACVAVPLASDALLNGRKTVEISHNGEIYRLQATRLGKLILTK